MHPDELAKKRHERNRFSRTNKPLDSEADQLGLAGELAFANLIGIDHTPSAKAPTKGYQFDLGRNSKIKVYTSRTPGNLFIKEGKVTADVYVLAGVTGDPVMENVYFVGWMHAKAVREAPVITPTRTGGYTVPAHQVPRDDLIPMKYLLAGLDVPMDRALVFPRSQHGGKPLPLVERTAAAVPVAGDAFAPRPIRKPKIGS